MNNKKRITVRTLSKKTDLGKDDVYVAYLTDGLKDKNVKNVGVFGTYGSGKSSVVGSFIKESKKKAIYFSQDTFNKYISKEDDKYTIDIRNAIYKELLSYTTSSIKLNEYLKALFNKKSDYVIYPILFVVFVLVSVFEVFYLNQFFDWLSYIIAAFTFLVATLIVILFNTKRIKELNVKIGNAVSFLANPNNDIKKSMKDHPATIENIIIRILKSKSVKYIVIEDIERLEKVSSTIIDYIREFKILNDVINRSQEYRKDPLVFIYGLKDWCIGDSEKRTKYFDLIIPVVPYSSFSNAEDSLLSDETIKKEISEDLVFDVSNYFSNQRQINALLSEYELTKEKTFSKGLENELFALSALNVLFPQIYCLLFYRDNFLDRILRKDLTNDSLVEGLRNEIKIDLNNVKVKERFSDEEIPMIASNDALLFLKTCILNGFITYNYEKLLCSNVENTLLKQDREIAKKIRSFEDISNDEIIDPKSLISSLHEKETVLFTNKKFLNIDLAHHFVVDGSPIQKNNFASLISKIKENDLVTFLNKYISKYNEKGFDCLTETLASNSALYLACPKVKNPLLACYYLLKHSNGSVVQSIVKEVAPFFDIINSQSFSQIYGRDIAPEKYLELSSTGLLSLEDISSFKNDNDHLRVFKENCLYKANYTNASIIYSDFGVQPIHYILIDKKVQNKCLSNISALVDTLDKCSSSETRDAPKEILSFVSLFNEEQATQLLNTKYFEKWLFKIDTSLFAGTKHQTLLLKNGIYNIFQKGFISTQITQYPNSIKACLDKYSDVLVNKGVFEEDDSWLLVLALKNADKTKKISNALSLTNVERHIPSVEERKIILDVCNCLDDDEKDRFLQIIADNNSDLLLNAIHNKTIFSQDLLHTKLNCDYLDLFVEEEDHSFANLFVLEQNYKCAVQRISANQSKDYSKLFFDNDGNVVECKEVELIIEYLCSSARNFDCVVALVESLDSTAFINKAAWRKFVHSFEDSCQKGYCYFAQYENNKKVLNKLASNHIVSEPIPVASRGQFKCKLF